MVNYLVFRPVQALDFLIGAVERFIDTGIFNRKGHRVRNGAHQFQVCLVKFALFLIDRAEDTDHSIIGRDRNINHVSGLIIGLYVHVVEEVGAFRGIGNNHRPAGSVHSSSYAFVQRKPDSFYLFADFGIVITGRPKEKFIFFIVDEDDRCTLESDEIFYLLNDIFETLIEAPETIKRHGDAKQGAIRPVGPFFPGDIPCNSPEPIYFTAFIKYWVGRNFKDPRLPILVNNSPYYIGNAFAGSIYRVDTLIGELSIFFVHEFSEIAILNLLPRVTKNPAKGIVKKRKIPS